MSKNTLYWDSEIRPEPLITVEMLNRAFSRIRPMEPGPDTIIVNIPMAAFRQIKTYEDYQWRRFFVR